MANQITGTLLDSCVLALLVKEDAYGYSLTQKMKETLDVSESTLYPVMRRLQMDECLTTYDESYNGRNRRYYKITEKGESTLKIYLDEWKVFKHKVDSILGGSKK